MELSLSHILPHLIYKFKSEDELVRSIEEISLKFTKNRDKISDYLNEPRLVAAYTAFYLLTNVPKLKKVLEWMPSSWVEEIRNCDFIDLGAGPGTFSLAWRELGGQGGFYQIEQSSLMREQGKRLWEGLADGNLFQGHRWEWSSERPRFLLFGHSANEMDTGVAISYIKAINPDHILFIEPGTKEFFGKMLELRHYLLQQNYNVLYPCPSAHPCPMSGTSDWCHQFIHVKQDDEVERISQMARKDRKLLPLTVQAFSRSFVTENPHERLVRVLPETKFSHEWEICHDNRLEHYQLLKREFSKSESKAIGNLLAGEAVVTEVIKQVEQTKRVKLLEVLKLS